MVYLTLDATAVEINVAYASGLEVVFVLTDEE